MIHSNIWMIKFGLTWLGYGEVIKSFFNKQRMNYKEYKWYSTLTIQDQLL
jgi:hypothetical protein